MLKYTYIWCIRNEGLVLVGSLINLLDILLSKVSNMSLKFLRQQMSQTCFQGKANSSLTFRDKLIQRTINNGVVVPEYPSSTELASNVFQKFPLLHLQTNTSNGEILVSYRGAKLWNGLSAETKLVSTLIT